MTDLDALTKRIARSIARDKGEDPDRIVCLSYATRHAHQMAPTLCSERGPAWKRYREPARAVALGLSGEPHR